jgi:hypothetical protein
VSGEENERRRFHAAPLLALIFLTVLVSHLPLLNLPYFWDEAGYYVAVAHDLLLTGSPIPHTTISNAHPPLVMAYLALWWKMAGFSPFITRTAMLLASAFTLLGIFRLAQRAANLEVAIGSVICTAFYPVFYAQSSLAHLDLLAAGFIFWGLKTYVEKRATAVAVWFSLAALTKETAILAPMALVAWELLRSLRDYKQRKTPSLISTQSKTLVVALLCPSLPLILWYCYHYLHTGFLFGNPEFFRYNVQATMHPLRILLALLMRLWQTFGYMNLFLLTGAGVLAMARPPRIVEEIERPRISLETQSAFLAVITAYATSMAVIGGAVLARYMLPAVPLVIIVFVSTLWRRIEMWRWVLTVVVLGFMVGLFVNPPYSFSLEDNLAYRDYVLLHQDAEHFIEEHYQASRVLTAWPASDELTRPFLGYVSNPLRIVRIEDFRLEQLMSAGEVRSNYDLALVFSTKYEPPRPILKPWTAWEKLKIRFFDYHHDVPPAIAAQILGGEIVYSEWRKGQWVAVIEIKQIMAAHAVLAAH